MQRRNFILGAAAAPLSAFAAKVRGGPYFVPGGSPNGLIEARYTVAGQQIVNNIGTINLPGNNIDYLLPLTLVVGDESNGADFTLSGQVITVNQLCKIRATLSVDWPGQYGVDSDMRRIAIHRVPAGNSLVVTPLPNLTKLTMSYDRLAAVEVPGSKPPLYERGTVQWAPGTVNAGKSAYIDVAVTPAGSINPGDFAQAGFSLPLDPGMIVEARVNGIDRVRVYMHNTTTGNLTVPTGTLNVLAGSSVVAVGGSTDAWSTLHTADEWCNAGDQIFGVICSKVTGDFIQTTGMTWLDVERVA